MPVQKEERKKTNFMISKDLLVEIKQYVPQGQRSDFVNGALAEAVNLFRRKKAGEEMEKLRQDMGVKMSTEEFIKLKNYGRE